jgi:hypothetical protein
MDDGVLLCVWAKGKLRETRNTLSLSLSLVVCDLGSSSREVLVVVRFDWLASPRCTRVALVNLLFRVRIDQQSSSKQAEGVIALISSMIDWLRFTRRDKQQGGQQKQKIYFRVVPMMRHTDDIPIITRKKTKHHRRFSSIHSFIHSIFVSFHDDLVVIQRFSFQ